MFDYLLSLLTVLAIAPASFSGVTPMQVYGQSVAVEPLLIQKEGIVSQAVATPRKIDPNNLGLVVSGQSVFVADVASGGVLFAKAPHDVRSIASLSKLMTSIVVLESDQGLEGNLSFVRSDFDYRSSTEFRINETIDKRDALKAMLVGSVNEVAVAFARSSGMSEDEFILRMNQKAKELHLVSLSFADPTGLNVENKGSAADVAALITIAMNYPEIREALNLSEINLTTKEGKEYNVESTNLLLQSFLNEDPYKIMAAKTGSLPEAGYCLAQVTRNSAGHEVVVVMLGGDNHFTRFKDVKALTSWVFDSYIW
ncbi:hypothetical protein KKG46_00880 [Patescibacteria group bacterium]|nr:hypothetical protein [Patescibacteria group bacterium]